MFISVEIATHAGTVKLRSLDKNPIHRDSGAAFDLFVNDVKTLSFDVPNGRGLFNVDPESVADHILGGEDFSRDKFVSEIQHEVIRSFNASDPSSRTPEARDGIKNSIAKLKMGVEHGMSAEDLLMTARSDAQRLFPMEETPHERISDAREFAVVRTADTNLKLAVVASVRTALLSAVQSYTAPRVDVPDLGFNDLSEKEPVSVEKTPNSETRAAMDEAKNIRDAREQRNAEVAQKPQEPVLTRHEDPVHEDDEIYDRIADEAADMIWDETRTVEAYVPEAPAVPAPEKQAPVAPVADAVQDEYFPDMFATDADPEVNQRTAPLTSQDSPKTVRPITGENIQKAVRRAEKPAEEVIPDFGRSRQPNLFDGLDEGIPDELDFEDPDFT